MKFSDFLQNVKPMWMNVLLQMMKAPLLWLGNAIRIIANVANFGS